MARWSILVLTLLLVGFCHCTIDEVLKETNWKKNHNVDESEDFDHLAVLGSRKEDKEYDEGSEEDAREKLTEIFHQMDLNDDEFISRDELKEWIKGSLERLDLESARFEFKKRDQVLNDEDEQISWDEYVMHTFGKTVSELEKLKAEPVHSEEDTATFFKNLQLDEKRFKLADVDNNGFLSEKEHVAFVHPYDHEHMTQSEVDQYLSESDDDKDGKISMDEYGRTRTEKSDTDLQRMAEEHNFKQLDEDKSGFLENDELLKMLKADSDDIPESETDHLFEETDDNDDKKLSLKEILKKQDVWVGSEATAFGEFFKKDEL